MAPAEAGCPTRGARDRSHQDIERQAGALNALLRQALLAWRVVGLGRSGRLGAVVAAAAGPGALGLPARIAGIGAVGAVRSVGAIGPVLTVGAVLVVRIVGALRRGDRLERRQWGYRRYAHDHVLAGSLRADALRLAMPPVCVLLTSAGQFSLK